MTMTIREYIEGSPEPVQARLYEIYALIKQALPDAQEKISWGMPTFYMKRNLIHFAPAKHHIGLYPGPAVIEMLGSELAGVKHSKGAIQLALNKPLNHDLIQKILDTVIALAE